MIKHSVSFKYKDEDVIRELRRQGVCYADIARQLNRDRKSIAKVCHILGLDMSEAERKKASKRGQFKPRINWQERLDSIYGVESVRFVKDIRLNTGESRLKIECAKCGWNTTISSVTTRTAKKQREFICLECIRLKKEQERLNKEYAKQEERRLQQIRKPKVQIAFGFCECGQILSRGKRACPKCRKEKLKEIYRRKDITRRAREREVLRDIDITLEKLYRRDKGICYLCGIKCNWEDSEKRDGTFIVGRTYPTIEHIVAISKGGSHTWDNIKLACLSCNSRKGAKNVRDISPWVDF